MNKPYFLVVAASKGYEPGLSALIHSHRIHHKDMGIKMLIGDCGLDEDFKKQHNGDDIEWIPIHSDRGHIFATKIHRFQIATKQEGSIVGIFDADMYICRSMLNMWKLAESGFIIGGSNASNIRFGSNWDESYGMQVPECWNVKTITSVPTFCDIDQHGDVWSEIYRHKSETNKGADFNLLNIFLCKLGKLDYVIPFSSAAMTGVHHQQVKLGTRIINKADELITENGLELFCVHGRFWEGNWCANLMKPIPKHLARMGIRSSKSKAYQGALQSRDLLQAEFDRYCHWPYDKSVKDATLENVKRETDLYFVESDDLETENLALVEKNLELATRIERLEHELKKIKSRPRMEIRYDDVEILKESVEPKPMPHSGEFDE